MTFASFSNPRNEESSSNADAKKVEQVNEVAKQVVSEVVSEVIAEVVQEDVRNEVSDDTLPVKVSFGDDIRRASFTPSSSFAALRELVGKLFGVDETSYVLKYQDDEGDKITMASDDELQEAVRIGQNTQKMLRIYVENKSSQFEGPFCGRWKRHQFRGRCPFSASFPAVPHLFHPHNPQLSHRSHDTHQGRTIPFHSGLLSMFKSANVPVNYSAPIFAHGTFSPASADPLPVNHEEIIAERLRMDRERQNFKARKHAMKETLKEMKASAVTQEDREAIKEYKAKMRAEFKYSRKGFKQQKKSSLSGKYVSDVTIADNSVLSANSHAVKTWRVRNAGTTAWPIGCQLICHSDNVNALERVVLERSVLPQEEVDVTISFTTPAEPGRYVTYFRLSGPDGVKFGERLWMAYIVPTVAPKLVDDSLEEAAGDGAQDPSRGFVMVDDLALD